MEGKLQGTGQICTKTERERKEAEAASHLCCLREYHNRRGHGLGGCAGQLVLRQPYAGRSQWKRESQLRRMSPFDWLVGTPVVHFLD